ncbi:unnamed protein product [Caenorhabditis angaria]|uniref:Uncharacterized protein n=1 Tax=Caenorhabditis angaria TaxID=860376 RepID=A0A9P1J3D4_9PELO|nr:unnamed protein product [Caenorhabditis angaria]
MESSHEFARRFQTTSRVVIFRCSHFELFNQTSPTDLHSHLIQQPTNTISKKFHQLSFVKQDLLWSFCALSHLEKMDPIDTGFVDLPYEMREIIIDKMDAYGRHLFARTCVTAKNDVARNGHYIDRLRLKRISKKWYNISVEFEEKLFEKRFCINKFTIANNFILKSARSVTYLSLSENHWQIWKIAPVQFSKLCVLILTTRRPQALLTKINTTRPLELLGINPCITLSQLDLVINKVKQVSRGIYCPTCTLSFDNVQSLAASSISIGLKNRNIEELYNYVKDWHLERIQDSVQTIRFYLHMEIDWIQFCNRVGVNPRTERFQLSLPYSTRNDSQFYCQVERSDISTYTMKHHIEIRQNLVIISRNKINEESLTNPLIHVAADVFTQ